MTQVTEGKNPVVIGRLGRNPAVPTVTFYGHYDVQPACEDNWMTNPFEVASVDGYLYGRGTSDNKARTIHGHQVLAGTSIGTEGLRCAQGPILGFVFAVRELLDACTESGKELPVNCAFCFEGEEENGSHGFAPTLEANKHWFEGTQVKAFAPARLV